MDSKRESWFRKPEYDAIANDCDIIIKNDIESIKKPKIYKDNSLDWLNDEVQSGMKCVLNRSMKRQQYRYGETGYVVRSDFKLIHIPVDGNYTSVNLSNGLLVQNLEQIGVKLGCLICIHNHPNNTDFSYSDILNFLHHDSISVIVVLGNTHNVFSLRKKYELDNSFNFRLCRRKLEIMYAKLTIQDKLDEISAKNYVSDFVLNNAIKFNLEFKHFNRGK